MGLGGQRHYSASLPLEKTRYPLYRRLGGPQGRSGRGRKISLPLGFDPRTVQPVASRYTDSAIAAHLVTVSCYETDELQFGNIFSANKVALFYSVDIYRAVQRFLD